MPPTTSTSALTPQEALPSITVVADSVFPRSLDLDLPTLSSLSLDLPTLSLPSLSLDLPTPTCTPTIQPDKNGYVPPGSCDALWQYSPSFAAATAFAVLFGILLIAHIVQAIYHRVGYTWVIIMAVSWEAASYGSRAAASLNQQSDGLATTSQLLVLVAPVWVNAFAYMAFARIVHFFSPTRKVWRISPSILTVIFVTLDIASFIVQIIGGGQAGPGASPEVQKQGINIYMGGIGMQEGFILIFLGLVIKFHWDQHRYHQTGHLAPSKRHWRPLLYSLYACLLFITIRIIFRLIEFSGGENESNPIPYNERYFYAFEAMPMFLAILVWNLSHPGRFIQGPDAKLPSSWISRKLCCCCHRSKRHPGGTEMAVLLSREPSPSREGFQERFSREVKHQLGGEHVRADGSSSSTSREVSPVPRAAIY
ncbi:hypothetical protein M409DRAFT_19067 [Zasmidium cellare ATCC 36951]|uniref:RTA1 domain protein n=1 Tax=Zasmidium cellare ATCC 36951 TaxID=1080233 RepID=A0A6A6D0C8_ZASCE|nr:uncharacterized protein M409DRAFT_19067 [Zasmidium cellare ATCC 36951]KAF2171096.1 hypothetical protein M409DRAFT_19067 [Zasmidium cellare ATCC 36951]